MLLGIEIGGTKLQLGVGSGDGQKPEVLQRLDIQPEAGAQGILDQIEVAAAKLIQEYGITRIGIGFGGPVKTTTGVVVTSHQISGWENFRLTEWCLSTLGVPASLGNDCDVAALAEARYGAGQGAKTVFFVTVGTGVGGGLVIDGKLHGQGRTAVAEIGHLRPGLECESSQATIESLASGWGIANSMRESLPVASSGDREELLQLCAGNLDNLNTKMIATSAEQGNQAACEVLQGACRALGWAIAQVITLIAPEIVVIGGGVSLLGEEIFFEPLRREVERYVFPPLLGSYKIVPAGLGELVVIHGALALASSTG